MRNSNEDERPRPTICSSPVSRRRPPPSPPSHAPPAIALLAAGPMSDAHLPVWRLP